jgi:hypothetical protein
MFASSEQLKHAKSDVEIRLLERFVNSFRDPMIIGEFFKTRSLTGYYARVLLRDYMFSNNPKRSEISDSIVTNVLFNFPTRLLFGLLLV